MKMRATICALVFTAMSVAAPVHAATFDLFDAFDGTLDGAPGSQYSFGYSGAGTFGGALTAFDTGCSSDPSVVCTSTSAIVDVGIFKAVVNGGAYDPPGTSFFDAGELNFHPGVGGQNPGFAFTAADDGLYSYAIGLSSNDTSTAGSIDYRLFQGTTLLSSGVLTGGATSLNGTATLAGGDKVTLLIGANGDYRYDSTGVSASFSTDDIAPSAVPEPASWALMMIGLGGIGASLRRRRSNGSLVAA